MPDRIVGPLTMLQFVYAVLGGGLAFFIYSTLPSPLNFLLAIIVALLTLAIIFLKINERPFSQFMLSLFRFMGAPKVRTWQKGQDSNLQVEIYKPPKAKSDMVLHKEISPDKIKEVARNIDTRNNEKPLI